jgi:CheY-like chemotaxis protein
MPKVLVVDDSVSVRRVVEKALESRRMEVVSAASGTEAIERIERDHPDLVVCDVLLPDKDGYQVCEFVRQRPETASTPVLLMSGVVNSTVLARAAEVQSSDVMFKPFAADELVRKVHGLLVPDAGEEAAPAEASPAPGAPGVDPAFTAAGLHERLEALAANPEIRFAALVDREGFLIDAGGEVRIEPEVAAALASCLADASAGIGRELGHGSLVAMMLEYQDGVLLLHDVAGAALLAVVTDPPALGKVRYCVKKALPDLERVL